MLEHQAGGRRAGPGARHRVTAHLLRAPVVEREPATERTGYRRRPHADHGVQRCVGADVATHLVERWLRAAEEGWKVRDGLSERRTAERCA